MLRRRARGVSLIELMISLAVLGLLVGIGVPAFKDMMKNYQIRTAAESLVSGLQTARNEAVRRNTTVRFQLVSTLDADCNTVQSGPHWIVSRNDPASKCDQAPVTDFLETNDTAQAQILMKANNASYGTAAINATGGGAAAVRAIFNSLGRVDPGSIDTIDVTNPSGGSCESGTPAGNMRCMRIRIGAGGQIRMCDPKVTSTTDSRYCQ